MRYRRKGLSLRQAMAQVTEEEEPFSETGALLNGLYLHGAWHLVRHPRLRDVGIQAEAIYLQRTVTDE